MHDKIWVLNWQNIVVVVVAVFCYKLFSHKFKIRIDCLHNNNYLKVMVMKWKSGAYIT